MKLLILTQKVNSQDPILGFFHRWIEEFALHYESVVVICLEKGDFNLPDNVKVLSLGKETKKSRLKYLINFYKYIWLERKNYDQVFVHMNQIYVLLGFLVWKVLGKKVGLWYAHGKASFSLWLANKMTDFVFTSTNQGFNVVSEKVNIIGQGIDTSLFRMLNKDFSDNLIITVGRISESKRNIEMLDLLSCLDNYNLMFVGLPTSDREFIYLNKLKSEIESRNLQNRVIIKGSTIQNDLVEVYNKALVFVNLSITNSLDKAILEAMACGVPVVTTNKSACLLLDKINYLFSVSHNLNIKDICDKINKIKLMSSEERISVANSLRDVVVSSHDLSNLILKITKFYERW